MKSKWRPPFSDLQFQEDFLDSKSGSQRGEILLKTNDKGMIVIVGALAILAIVLFIIILIAAYDPAVKQTILDFLHAIFGQIQALF
ncbi:MAG TPA: hypothetical protein VJ574_06410 [Candidatus Bathyarchaeia archaeon]|nr:hypothetical protein [Candidatus Bathyarchaeia archaeon]